MENKRQKLFENQSWYRHGYSILGVCDDILGLILKYLSKSDTFHLSYCSKEMFQRIWNLLTKKKVKIVKREQINYLEILARLSLIQIDHLEFNLEFNTKIYTNSTNLPCRYLFQLLLFLIKNNPLMKIKATFTFTKPKRFKSNLFLKLFEWFRLQIPQTKTSFLILNATSNYELCFHFESDSPLLHLSPYLNDPDSAQITHLFQNPISENLQCFGINTSVSNIIENSKIKQLTLMSPLRDHKIEIKIPPTLERLKIMNPKFKFKFEKDFTNLKHLITKIGSEIPTFIFELANQLESLKLIFMNSIQDSKILHFPALKELIIDSALDQNLEIAIQITVPQTCKITQIQNLLSIHHT